VKNDSTIEGDEVVQLYVAGGDGSIRDLRGFERVHLRPGETRQVSFTMDELPAQKVQVTVGGGQPVGRVPYVKAML
jgi:beta-glucosidase